MALIQTTTEAICHFLINSRLYGFGSNNNVGFLLRFTLKAKSLPFLESGQKGKNNGGQIPFLHWYLPYFLVKHFFDYPSVLVSYKEHIGFLFCYVPRYFALIQSKSPIISSIQPTSFTQVPPKFVWLSFFQLMYMLALLKLLISLLPKNH